MSLFHLGNAVLDCKYVDSKTISSSLENVIVRKITIPVNNYIGTLQREIQHLQSLVKSLHETQLLQHEAMLKIVQTKIDENKSETPKKTENKEETATKIGHENIKATDQSTLQSTSYNSFQKCYHSTPRDDKNKIQNISLSMRRNEVISNMRTCFTSGNKKIALKQLEENYLKAFGEVFPFEKLGYKDAASFLSSISTLKIETDSLGETWIESRSLIKENNNNKPDLSRKRKRKAQNLYQVPGKKPKNMRVAEPDYTRDSVIYMEHKKRSRSPPRDRPRSRSRSPPLRIRNRLGPYESRSSSPKNSWNYNRYWRQY